MSNECYCVYIMYVAIFMHVQMLRLCYLMYTFICNTTHLFCPNKLLYKTIICFSSVLLLGMYLF